MSHTHIYTHTRPFNGLLSKITRVGRYQKKHSPTHTHEKEEKKFAQSSSPLWCCEPARVVKTQLSQRHSGLCTNSVRTACPAQAWVERPPTAWRLPRSRRRKTHVCIQRLVGIRQSPRQTEDLFLHSSLYSHWFLFSKSSRFPLPLHFFGWETI